MLSIRTLASGNISFTNYAPFFLPLRAEYPLFQDTRQHNGKKARLEHPGRKTGLVAEPEAAEIPRHTMAPHPCCVMNPECSFHISRAAGCWARRSQLQPCGDSGPTLRKAQIPLLLPRVWDPDCPNVLGSAQSWCFLLADGIRSGVRGW